MSIAGYSVKVALFRQFDTTDPASVAAAAEWAKSLNQAADGVVVEKYSADIVTRRPGAKIDETTGEPVKTAGG